MGRYVTARVVLAITVFVEDDEKAQEVFESHLGGYLVEDGETTSADSELEVRITEWEEV